MLSGRRTKVTVSKILVGLTTTLSLWIALCIDALAAPKTYLRDDGAIVLRFSPRGEGQTNLEIDLHPLRCQFSDGTTQVVSIQYFFRSNPTPESFFTRVWNDQWDVRREFLGVTIDTDMDGKTESQSVISGLDLRLEGTLEDDKMWEHLADQVHELPVQTEDFGIERPTRNAATGVWSLLTLSGGTYTHIREELGDAAIEGNHSSRAAARLRDAKVESRVMKCVWTYLRDSDPWSGSHSRKDESDLKPFERARFKQRRYMETMLSPGVGEAMVAVDSVVVAATVLTAGKAGAFIGGLKSGGTAAVKTGLKALAKRRTWSQWARQGVVDGAATFGIGNGIYLGTETWRTGGENLGDKKFWINFGAVGLSNFVSGFVTNMGLAPGIATDTFVSAVCGSLAEYAISENATHNFFLFQGAWGGALAQPRVRFFRKVLPGFLGPRIGAASSRLITNGLWAADQVAVNGIAFGWSADRLTDLPYSGHEDDISDLTEDRPMDIPLIPVDVKIN